MNSSNLNSLGPFYTNAYCAGKVHSLFMSAALDCRPLSVFGVSSFWWRMQGSGGLGGGTFWRKTSKPCLIRGKPLHFFFGYLLMLTSLTNTNIQSTSKTFELYICVTLDSFFQRASVSTLALDIATAESSSHYIFFSQAATD